QGNEPGAAPLRLPHDGQLGPALLDGPQHPGGPGRVVVAQGAVVVVVDVAGLVLVVEVAQGLQQEPALFLEVGEDVDVDGCTAGGDSRHVRSSSRSTRARSSGDTDTPGPARQRQTATPRPARAQTRAATGSTHTRLATPDDLGFRRRSSP